MSQTLDILTQDARSALLLAETAAWLHMLGKYHEDFLVGKLDLATQLPSDLPDRLLKLLDDDWPGREWKKLNKYELQTDNLSIKDLVENHHNPHAQTGFGRLLSDAHGRASGIEKGPLVRFARVQSGEVCMATPMGYEAGRIDLREFHDRRLRLYDFLEAQLKSMQRSTDKEWPALRKSFIDRIGLDFRGALAESRRPLNDVSLYDQTIATVALFKAALAQVLLTGWREPDVKKVDDRYHWRFLRLGLDGPAFWREADGVNDLRSRKGLITGLMDEARDLLEQEIPLGLEIYRDEHGSVLIAPNVEGLLEYTFQKIPLRQQLEDLAKIKLDGEASFTVSLSEPTRSMRDFGKFVNSPLPPPAPDPVQVASWWSGSTLQASRQVCRVCGLRPQGPSAKAAQRGLCDTCETRRGDRSKSWTGNLARGTIWMGEVADRNGRLALLVGKFDIGSWLSGEVFNSLLAFDPVERVLSDPGRDGLKYQFSYDLFLQESEAALRNPHQTLGKQTPLLDKLLLRDQRGEEGEGEPRQFGDIYDLYVADTDLNAAQRESWRFALSLMRLQPSFARIRRAWETTQNFWKEVEEELARIVKQSGPRLEIRGALFPEDDDASLVAFHVYELTLKAGQRLNVVWDAPNRRLITADNLERVADRLGRETESDASTSIQSLFTGRLRLEEPLGRGAANRRWGEIQVQESGLIPGSEFPPVVPIMAEPGAFMALVPAEAALRATDSIRQKYAREMGMVANRLPLRLGMIPAPQHTPLRILLEAGRRMLDSNWMGSEDWQVGQLDDWHGLSLEKEGHQVAWQFASAEEDSKVLDPWRPYMTTDSPPTESQRHLDRRYYYAPGLRRGSARIAYVHAGEAVPGGCLEFTPSTFDFAWLDNLADRFEITYDPRGIRLGLAKRPYILDELTLLEKIWEVLRSNLSINQIYILRDVIEDRRESWQPNPGDCSPGGTFWQFCWDALRNAQWETRPDIDWDGWANYAVRGWLADAVELNLHILKEKSRSRF